MPFGSGTVSIIRVPYLPFPTSVLPHAFGDLQEWVAAATLGGGGASVTGEPLCDVNGTAPGSRRQLRAEAGEGAATREVGHRAVSRVAAFDSSHGRKPVVVG